MGETDLFQIFIGNLFKFDMIIFIAALANLWCFILVRRVTIRLYNTMHYTIFIPSHDPYGHTTQDIFNISESDVIIMRKKTGVLYNIFTTLTGIFTLFGILGTVMSLLPIVENMDTIKANFFVALTSTFWGLVFAIVFKILDATIAGRIEDNEKTVALFLTRNAGSFLERK
jgi:chemotaxis protein MotA